MKVNFSLSLKLTLIVVFVSATIIFSLTYVNISEQTINLDGVYTDKAKSMAKNLDIIIGSKYGLDDEEELQNILIDYFKNSTEITELSLNLEKGNNLTTVASTNLSKLGKQSDKYSRFSYENDTVLYIPIHKADSHFLTVVIPMNISGQVLGTYELRLNMIESYEAFNARAVNLVMISIISLFFLIFSLLLLLRRAVVKPVIEFRDAAKQIGKGDLDKKIGIRSNDELGELSNAFNKMTEDLKKSRKKIEDYNQILEKLLDQKDAFIGQLGHDLKNPLQPLVGLLPLIMQREKDPKIKEHLKVMCENVEYMRDLIVKTLQLARLRSANTKFDIENLNLKEEVETILTSQTLLFNEKNVEIDNKITSNILIEADKLRLRELFNNLLTNSIKYTPDSGGKITLAAEPQKDFVKISVSDNGIGMTSEQLEIVFDEFYKADASQQEMISTGLGLSICKHIVEKHGGKIWVDSPGIGKGSTFYFTLKTSNK
ncbi:MAG: HAMP domain-containing histidine kinase [Candidatus Thermoplasmatota archaeon]|nr:HAMP domain-containing histidine kinase [Candidatus Thermoplasmatota archaeon]